MIRQCLKLNDTSIFCVAADADVRSGLGGALTLERLEQHIMSARRVVQHRDKTYFVCRCARAFDTEIDFLRHCVGQESSLHGRATHVSSTRKRVRDGTVSDDVVVVADNDARVAAPSTSSVTAASFTTVSPGNAVVEPRFAESSASPTSSSSSLSMASALVATPIESFDQDDSPVQALAQLAQPPDSAPTVACASKCHSFSRALYRSYLLAHCTVPYCRTCCACRTVS